jgi:hypothetical protein
MTSALALGAAGDHAPWRRRGQRRWNGLRAELLEPASRRPPRLPIALKF